jgi:DUF1680 family protein
LGVVPASRGENTVPDDPALMADGAALPSSAHTGRVSIKPVEYSQVTITDPFWSRKVEKIATVTLQACIVQTEQKSGRIRNFEKAARNQGEQHEGMFYDDSDVYKAIEAMAYSLSGPYADLERKADEWIGKIAAAQQPDGYLNTYFVLTGLEKRWTDMGMHEDYCAGHLIEAAVAYYHSTGKRTLLDVAIRFADHLDAHFRLPNRHWVSGHEEIELALMKLYHLVHEERYFKLAEWYLDQRGRGFGKGDLWSTGAAPDYCQDDVPVKKQRRITGHAVRAMYLYSGVADVAAVTGDSDYLSAMQAVWEDVVYRNLYVTGGIGSSGDDEGFSRDYDLPNAQAYCETCASVGMVFWNQRMALLTGDSRYIDVLERTLYNAALDGLSLSGDHFFYGNPLASSASSGQKGRSEWFGTACCPSNIARLVASIGGYFYSVSDQDVWINLFATSHTRIRVGRSDVELKVLTQYPWDGHIRVELDPVKRARFALHLRIPGWAKSVAVPGNLYSFTDTEVTTIGVLLNGKPVRYQDQEGYAVIDREWRPGDVIELNLPMPIKQVTTRREVTMNRNRVAFQRGPIVYCVEGADNVHGVWNLIMPRPADVRTQDYKIADEPVVALRGEGLILTATTDGLNVTREPHTMIAIPYYTWANRDNYDMQVWLPTRINDVTIGA